MSLTRLVQTMSSVHSTTASMRSGELAASTFFSKQHFPKFLAATMMASGLAGYYTMEHIQQKQWETRDALYDRVYDDHKKRQEVMHPNEGAVVHANLSSWQENNAAQDPFMLGSTPGREDSTFLSRIRERAIVAGASQEEGVLATSSTNNTSGDQYRWATGE